jgi:hypothetical protein
MEKSNKILSDITVFMKYAKYRPDLGRRETWEELVDRNKEMHISKYPAIRDEIEVCNLGVNLLKLVQTEYIIAATFLLMITELLMKFCFFF